MSTIAGSGTHAHRKSSKNELEDAEMRVRMGLDADLRNEEMIDPDFAVIHAKHASGSADRVEGGYGLGDERVLSAARAM